MLLLAVLQCVFVSFESAGIIHGNDDSTIHHEKILADQHENVKQLDLASGPDSSRNSCDHCCQCHGHCTHVPLLPHHDIFVIGFASVHPRSSVQDFQSNRIHSIHRPPIA